jgi:hypothetical protein
VSALSPKQKQWLDDYCNGTISSTDFAKMEAALLESADFRGLARKYLAMDSNLHLGTDSIVPLEDDWKRLAAPAERRPAWWAWAAVAGIAFLIGINLRPEPVEQAIVVPAESPAADSALSHDDGIAVIENTVEPIWTDGTDVQLDTGSILSPGPFKLTSGLAQLQFYNGARLIIEGPAELELVSVEQVICHRGKLRGHIPPGAEGFTVISARFELVDLGTEFGVEVHTDGNAKVEVFDGEVVLYPPDSQRSEDEARRLLGGSGVEWTTAGDVNDIGAQPSGFTSQEEVERQRQHILERRVVRWQRWRDRSVVDPRVVVQYEFANDKDSLIDEAASELHGVIVGSEWSNGRLPGKQALEFKRPSDRARINVPGEYDSATFAAWIRVDALPNRRQSLLLTDGHKLGHVHWQIGDRGELRFGMRIERGGQEVGHGYGAREVFLPRQIGVWSFVCASYDRDAGQVKQYFNGRRISEHDIVYDQPLQIGRADIGNWSKHAGPIRNFVGRIDGLTIWKVALSDDEIGEMYRHTRP